MAGAFGVRGEIRITAYTEDPLSLLTYSLKRDDHSASLALTAARAVKGALIARAGEAQTREQAQALRGLRLYIDRADLPEPEENAFYIADLVGLTAQTPTGEAIGRVKSVCDFGAGDLLEIDPGDGGPTWWAPFTRAVVPEVRLVDGLVVVARPEEIEE